MAVKDIAVEMKWNGLCTELGTLLRLSLARQSISIRQLGRLTGISAATISRIVSGKQTASIYQLQQFAMHLDVAMEELLQSVGIANIKQAERGSNFLWEIIQDVVKDLEMDLDSIAADILKELHKLEHYARTKEGERMILDNFSSKINATDGTGAIISKLNHFYSLFCSENVDSDRKAIMGSALLYFTLTVGVIPDYCFPIGYLDDAIAVKLVEKKLSQLKDQHKNQFL